MWEICPGVGLKTLPRATMRLRAHALTGTMRPSMLHKSVCKYEAEGAGFHVVSPAVGDLVSPDLCVTKLGKDRNDDRSLVTCIIRYSSLYPEEPGG